MCILTKNFIYDVRAFFYELNYDTTKGINFNDYINTVNDAISRCKEEDMFKVMYNADYCIRRWGKICRIFERRADYYYSIKLTGKSDIHNMRYDHYQATDTLTLIDNYLYDCKGKRYFTRHRRSFEVNSDFEINKYAVFYKGERLFKFVERDVMLRRNVTGFEVYKINGNVCIFRKEYINRLSAKEQIDLNKMVASISGLAADKSFERSYARINYYQQVNAYEQTVIKCLAAHKMIYQRDRVRSFNATMGYIAINTLHF